MQIRKETIVAVLGSPVAYYAAFAKPLGSVEAGIFASQLFYWSGKGRDPQGWIYKTQAEIDAETGLARRSQETARRHLRQLGVLEEKVAGIPAKLYYRLNLDALFALVNGGLDEQEPVGHAAGYSGPGRARPSQAQLGRVLGTRAPERRDRMRNWRRNLPR